MIDKIKELFSAKANSGGLLLFALGLIFSVLILFILMKIVKCCFAFEKAQRKPAHTLVKTIMIALAPTIYSILSMLNIVDDNSFKIPWIISGVMGVIVVIWNIVSFGVSYGIMFSVIHIVFGIFASFGMAAFIFIGIAAVALSLFVGGSSGRSMASSSAPEYVRNTATGETVYVEKGANGELYIMGTSNVLRSSDYSGRYFDDYGNQYISG